MAKVKADYKVYQKWYNKYSKTTVMKDKELTEEKYWYWYRRARAAKVSMKDFSRTLAMRQRQASELQLRTTWVASKKAAKEIKKTQKIKERDFIRQQIEAEERAKHKRISKKELERRIKARYKKGISPELREAASEFVAEEMSDQLSFLKEFEKMTWVKFRMDQRSVLKKVRKALGVDTREKREEWDAIFMEALKYVYREQGNKAQCALHILCRMDEPQ